MRRADFCIFFISFSNSSGLMSSEPSSHSSVVSGRAIFETIGPSLPSSISHVDISNGPLTKRSSMHSGQVITLKFLISTNVSSGAVQINFGRLSREA